MKRLAIGLTIAGVVFAGAFAFAASLGVTPDSLQAGSGGVGQCDTNGVTVSWPTPSFTNGTGYTVNQVTVAGVDSTNCSGKTLYVTLTDASNNALVGGGSAAVSGTSFTVNMAGAASAANVLNAHVAIA